MAEKALRWAAAPKTDCDTFLAANIMAVVRNVRLVEENDVLGWFRSKAPMSRAILEVEPRRSQRVFPLHLVSSLLQVHHHMSHTVR